MFLVLISSITANPIVNHKQVWNSIKNNEKLHTDEVHSITKRQVSRELSSHGNGHIVLAVEEMQGAVISRLDNTSVPATDDGIIIRKKKDTESKESKDSNFLPTTFSAKGDDDEEDTALHWFGFPRYERVLPPWLDFTKKNGILNRECDEKEALAHCGYKYPCIKNVCSRCTRSKECPDKYVCVPNPKEPQSMGINTNICVPRDLLTQWTWGDTFATILITITAMLCAVAGLGGGGVYVPLLLLLGGLSPKEAVPLSQVMIVGGAIVNVLMFMGDSHPKFKERPRIDFEIVMMLNPSLACGVTLGVICHIISPSWLIVLLLIITLVIAFHKTFWKGIATWQKESKVIEAKKREAPVPSPKAEPITIVKANSTVIKEKTMSFIQNYINLGISSKLPISLIVLCWSIFFGMSLISPEKCSLMYWIKVLIQVGIALCFTLIASVYCLNHDKEGDLSWSPRTKWLYPLLSAASGFLGGFLGIGGGMIMGPLLLELGMIPEANQATTAMFVFLSSSLATLQFFLLDAEMPQYVAWYASWVAIATLIGQTGMEYLLSKYNRPSLIILCIATVVGVSLIMMSVVGVIDVAEDVRKHASMSFQPHILCGR